MLKTYISKVEFSNLCDQHRESLNRIFPSHTNESLLEDFRCCIDQFVIEELEIVEELTPLQLFHLWFDYLNEYFIG